MPETPSWSLSRISGEFRSPQDEAIFQDDCLAAPLRRARLLFLLSGVLFGLLAAVAWRLSPSSGPSAVLVACTVAALTAFLCLWTVRQAHHFPQVQGPVLAWQAIVAVTGFVLAGVSPDAALSIAVLLPTILYAIAPTRFLWTAIAAVGSTLLAVLGHVWAGPSGLALTGLVPVLLLMNLVLAFATARWNGLLRLEWMERHARRAEPAADHDELTGLPGRGLLQRHLEQVLGPAQDNGTGIGLILVHLDNLETIEGRIGPMAGETLLVEAASRLRALASASDMVARFGDGTFALALPLDDVRGDPLLLVERVLGDLRQPVFDGDGSLQPQISVGIAQAPMHGRHAPELIGNAILALSAAKAQGPHSAVVYTPDMRRQVERKADIVRSLQEALRVGQIVPYYQPKVDLMSGRVVGFEALARWHHPVEGVLAPEAFDEALEDPDLSRALGECMIRQVAADIRSWLDDGIDCGRVAVNLASAQFDGNGQVRRFLDPIRAAGVPNERLEVEVTETVLLGKRTAHVARVLGEFHDQGIRIALDDFGTGYASLVHLRQLPADSIKIDRSFVGDIATDPDSAAIVLAVVELGESLGMSVVAEGVETPEQARFLRENGCSQAQGNLYGTPMAAGDVSAFLSGRKRRRA